jgi:hypothetical protein
LDSELYIHPYNGRANLRDFSPARLAISCALNPSSTTAGTLQNVGYSVSDQTVDNILRPSALWLAAVKSLAGNFDGLRSLHLDAHCNGDAPKAALRPGYQDVSQYIKYNGYRRE